MYKDEFVNFVNNGLGRYYIGIGNPNASMLLIGKESSIDAKNIEEIKKYNRNAQNWENLIIQNEPDILEYPVKDDNTLKSSWGKNTWSKYQRLSDIIREKVSQPYYVDFLKFCFTTELNDAPMKRTSEADKSGIKDRKILFKNSELIQNFPVIVLACSGYIQNNEETREIDDIFGVTYCGDEEGKHCFGKGNWFYLHYSPDRKKLVIHTRQLSNNVKNEMIIKMGHIIRKHLMGTGELQSVNS